MQTEEEDRAKEKSLIPPPPLIKKKGEVEKHYALRCRRLSPPNIEVYPHYHYLGFKDVVI